MKIQRTARLYEDTVQPVNTCVWGVCAPIVNADDIDT